MFTPKLLKPLLAPVLFTATIAHSATPSVLTLSADNDLFSPIQNDRDYTAGVAIAYSGDGLQGDWNLTGRSLNAIDALFLPEGTSDQGPGALEFGVYGFTPEEISSSPVIEDDRPYSSLVYLSSSRSQSIQGSDNTWTSTLTIGVLGLDIFENGQNLVHEIIDSPKAEGWRHQISDGGELTARYSLAYHSPLGNRSGDNQWKSTFFGSVGYLTEVGAALVFRDGLISSPSERFNPELSTYGEGVSGLNSGRSNESYFWGGIAAKVRIYNAFLEGQFRDSEHTISRSQLNIGLLEAWAGYTHSFLDAYKFSYVLRAQSSEIKEGKGDRTLLWGGFIFSKTF